MKCFYSFNVKSNHNTALDSLTKFDDFYKFRLTIHFNLPTIFLHLSLSEHTSDGTSLCAFSLIENTLVIT